MHLPPLLRLVVFFFPILLCAAPPAPSPGDRQIPPALREWESWATWNDGHRFCPTPFNTADKHICFWPSRLNLQVDRAAGRWNLSVTVFSETWVPLPGSKDVWPVEVKLNGTAIPVVEHDEQPSVRLAPGTFRLEGGFLWNEIPQGIPLPSQIGVLALTVDGQPVSSPTWDAEGFLWLKRDASTEEADKDFLSAKVYALLEDGIPLWLRTQVELIVSGKSREEDIGSILPEGWKLASVESPIPVMIDDAGRMRAQVRTGKWTITASAFRLDNPPEFRYAPDAKPASAEELVAFRAKPDFRMVDITGSPSIDVSQTTFPSAWREYPVYRWDTATAFILSERMRGMGLQAPQGLTINRTLWLDENGAGLTFRDHITGSMQQIWRLDAAEGQDLGSVRSNGQGQLITRNPENHAPGVEIRSRNLNLEAVGRAERSGRLPATGWRADADSLNVSLHLPPGWRLFALFGADAVEGDWLTAWSLLDLFLLLIFTLAVFRLWGFVPAVVAFLAFGISYHEPGAPRFIWLALIIPLALLKVVPDGWGRRLVLIAKWIAIVLLVLIAAPFLSQQVQRALFPQLESVGRFAFSRAVGHTQAAHFEAAPNAAATAEELHSRIQDQETPLPQRQAEADSGQMSVKVFSGGWSKSRGSSSDKSNLLYDAKARIQTGPGVPEWTWRTVTFRWNGPVAASQQVRPILISVGLERVLTVLRIVLLLALAAILLGVRRWSGKVFRGAGQAALWAALLTLGFPTARAQEIPDKETLETLRERLLEPSDAYPNAANISSVALSIREGKLSMDAELHTALQVAVPLPGQLPDWSPLSVIVDGKPEPALRRDDGYLWVVLPAGVHRVQVEGRLADVTEWEWTFLLKPRRVTIDAPGWNVSGVRPDGVPDQQIFFAQQQKATAGQASYDRQDYQTLVVVERHLELGLIWQVRTTVSRLSPEGKAVSLRVPLLPGENVLTSNAIVKDGCIEARLGAQERAFVWESELTIADTLKLSTKPGDTWVERWNLVVSPVWNVTISGLPPVFLPGNPELVPVWHPWPGESVELAISRPEAIPGATVTVNKGTQSISLGARQRTTSLNLSLRCSLGEDFLVGLPAGAQVTSLTFNGSTVPVRKDGDKVIVPLRPGEQRLALEWKTNTPLGFLARAEQVTLPVESANITTQMSVPDNRWVLWTNGPLRGPAVRFWTVLVCCFIAAWVLGRLELSPLRPFEWGLLALGLTQVPLVLGLIVVAWLFFLAWRGRESFLRLPVLGYNFLQVVLIGLTGISLLVFIGVVWEGLLGDPLMFIIGNDSTPSNLNWYQPRCDSALPTPGCYSVSIWWFRILMLAWALWLAASLIRWLNWGWKQFSTGGCFRKEQKKPATPPPLNAA
jgi:hypothetical protein